MLRIEPHVEPVNGVVQPPVYPPPNRPGRITNQLHYLKTTIIKGTELLLKAFEYVLRVLIIFRLIYECKNVLIEKQLIF